MTFAYQNPQSHSFVPEIWDSELLVAFDPLLVWASPIVSNNKYEGEIRKKGDVVHINSLLPPSVGDYKLPDGMTAQRPETADQKLPITEAKYLQVLVEYAERVQLASGLDSPINQQMIRSLAREADTFMGNIIAKGATALPTVKATAQNAPQSLYSAILDMMLALDDNDIPAGRYVVVSPRVKRYLIEHPAVANAAAYGEGGVTANGVVARLAGFTILTTTAMPKGVDIVAGHKEFATYASQFSGFREGQSEKYRADYIDTLHLYGGKIVRYPELDTKKVDNTFDESKPTKGICKIAVDWSA
ncbi:phage major capsid protein [Streptomyces decoyicus]|uniref:phage major capsid protein n=1 Tax=Streptomyces decoyicus TaxID=249567 RepID=UPI00386A33B9